MFGFRPESRFTSYANKSSENFCIKINNKQQSAVVIISLRSSSPTHQLHYTALSSSDVASVGRLWRARRQRHHDYAHHHCYTPRNLSTIIQKSHPLSRWVHQHHVRHRHLASGVESSWKTFYMNKLCLFLCINFPFFCV